MTQQHTPLPWGTDGDRDSGTLSIVQADTGGLIATLEETLGYGFVDEANARFIVQAVNVHDDLLAALERLMSLQYHCDYSDVPDPEVCPGDPPEDPGPCHWCEARAAIDKATSLQAPGP